jgi:hypothetical protein
METSRVDERKVHKVDRDIFPKQNQFSHDVKKYKEELDKQRQLNELVKKVSETREKLYGRILIQEDRKQANLNKTIRNGNLENLMKSFYSRVRLPNKAYGSPAG